MAANTAAGIATENTSSSRYPRMEMPRTRARTSTKSPPELNSLPARYSTCRETSFMCRDGSMAGLYSGWNRAWVAVIGVLVMVVPAAAQQHDPFYWLGEINKASTVMVVERGIVPKELGSRIADSVRRVTAAGDHPGAARSGNYLVIEDALIKDGGPDMTRLHSGRSRQDIGATIQRLAMRDDLLEAFDRLNGVGGALLA